MTVVGKVEDVTPADAVELQEGGAVLLDVREDDGTPGVVA